MRARLRILLVVLVFLLLAGGSAILARELWRQRNMDLRQQAFDLLPRVAQRIRDFHRVKVDDGRKVWEVSAKEAQYYDDEEVVVVEQPHISVYLKDGRVISLSGKQGKVFLGDRDLRGVELSGNIDVQLGDYALRADSARYDRERDLIVVPGQVEIRGEDFDLRGKSMEIQVGSQRLTLADGVQTILRPDA